MYPLQRSNSLHTQKKWVSWWWYITASDDETLNFLYTCPDSILVQTIPCDNPVQPGPDYFANCTGSQDTIFIDAYVTHPSVGCCPQPPHQRNMNEIWTKYYPAGEVDPSARHQNLTSLSINRLGVLADKILRCKSASHGFPSKLTRVEKGEDDIEKKTTMKIYRFIWWMVDFFRGLFVASNSGRFLTS